MPPKDSKFDRRTYLKATGLAGTAGLTGLAGCTLGGNGGNGGNGGDGDGDTTTDGTTSGDSEPIVIGATLPETGRLSSVADDFKQGYNLGVKMINQNGGINGRQVELIIRDDESDPAKVRERLQQITSNNDVDMLWGSFSSLLVTAGSAYAESQGIPFVGTAFAYMKPHIDNNYEWTYAAMPKSRDVANSTLGMFNTLPEGDRPQNVGIWEPNTGWGKEQSDYWEETLSNNGYNVALREKYSLGTSDFSTLISQSKSQNVDAVLSVPVPPGAITAMKQMKSNGFSPKAVQFVRGADPTAFWNALGSDGEYVTMCPGWVPGMTGGGNQTMHELYSANYEMPESGLLPVLVGTSFTVPQVAKQALAAAEEVSPTALQSALRSTTFETVMGTFNFQDNGLPKEGELTAPVGQWWNGAQHVCYPDQDGEAAIDFKYPLTPWNQR